MNYKLTFEIIQCISVIIASITAIYGITSWRREARWKREYELGEEVLAVFYECKEKIEIIRSPFSYVNEGKTRKRSEEESPDESKILDNAYVAIERYEKEKESFIKLYTLKFRFMAVFGKGAGESFDEVRIITNRILYASKRLGSKYWQEQGRKSFSSTEFDLHLKEMHKYEEIFWSGGKNDEIEKQLEICISKIEKYCSSITKR